MKREVVKLTTNFTIDYYNIEIITTNWALYESLSSPHQDASIELPKHAT